MYLFQHYRAAGFMLVTLFTFHYVSISTLWILLKLISLLKFTFHYVSISTRITFRNTKCAIFIYIPLCIYFNIIDPVTMLEMPYLHSTMYLFQPDYTLVYTNDSRLFTFHYVSISTGNVCQTVPST